MAELANDFITSVLCIDDDVYNGKEKLDTEKIVKSFAARNVLCTLYSPSSESDLDTCVDLAKKADVLILDWCMLDINSSTSSLEDISPDGRGQFAKKIIERLVMDCRFQAKLILVYTNETRADIFTETKKLLEDKTGQEVSIDEAQTILSLDYFRVVFVRKGERPSANKDKLYCSESELADFVLSIFNKMTSGLLQQFALFALNLIRKNTNEILAVLSREADCGYLVHKGLLEYKDDSCALIKLIFCELIRNLIDSNLDSFKRIERNWIFEVFDSEVSRAFLTQDKWDEKTTGVSKFSYVREELGKSDKFPDQEISFYKFASLSHLRIPLPHNINQPPMLSLGTILKCINGIESKECNFLLCIQPKCDSVRVQSSRPFLFLQLEKAEIKVEKKAKNDFAIIVDKENCFSIKKESYSIVSINFNPTEGADRVIAESSEDGNMNGFIFTDQNNNRYRYLGELSETYALREVDRFTAKLGRIGIDEFEWMRVLKKGEC